MSEHDTIHLENFRIQDIPGAVPALFTHPTAQEQKIDFLAQGTLVSHRAGPGPGQAYKINKNQFLKMGEALWGLGDTEFRKVFSSEKEQIFATHILLDCLHAQMREVDRGAVLQLVKEKSGKTVAPSSKLLIDNRKVETLLLALGLSQEEIVVAKNQLFSVPGRVLTNARDGIQYLHMNQEDLIQFCSQQIKDLTFVDRQIEILQKKKKQTPADTQLLGLLEKSAVPVRFTTCMSEIERLHRTLKDSFASNKNEAQLVVLQQIHTARRKLEGVCTPQQNQILQKALKELALMCFMRIGMSDVPENLIRDFSFSEEERYGLVQDLRTKDEMDLSRIKRNIKSFNLAPKDRLAIAHNFLAQGESLASVIDTFELTSEKDRFELALEELRRMPKCDLVSQNMSKYSIFNPELRLALAEEALKNEDGSRFFANLSKYGIQDEEKRFALCMKCVQKHGDEALTEWSDPSAVTLEHRIALIREIGPRASGTTLIENWRSYQFDYATTKELLFHFVTTNPIMFYESWKNVSNLLLPEDCELLRARIPFFALNETIARMNAFPQSPSRVLADLKDVLKELHNLNKKSGVPFSFYKHLTQGERANLDTLIASCAKTFSKQELLQLVSLLHENYFCGTNYLFHSVVEEALPRFPELKSQIDRHRTDPWCRAPSITAERAQSIVQASLKKHMMEKTISFPGVVYLKNIADQLKTFYASGQQKGVFLVNFSPEFKGGHFSPLIVEREGTVLHILNSDSVFRGENDFTKEILMELKDLPFEKQLYIVPYARQNDVAGCSIFSIRDIKEAIKSMSQGQSFFEYLRANSRIVQGKIEMIDVLQVSALPVRMMRMTQSLTAIKKFAVTASPFVHKGGVMTLQEYVEGKGAEEGTKYFRYDMARKAHLPTNAAVGIRAATYFKRIFEDVLQSPEVRPESLRAQ